MSRAAQVLARIAAARRPGIMEALRADSGAGAGQQLELTTFEAAFAAAGRRLGIDPAGAGVEIADATGHAWSIAGWGLDEVGRAVLLLDGVCRIPAPAQIGWVDGLYRAGALRERQAVLRALALLPDPVRFLPTALDACRASAQPIFEAIACENPYPAAYFPESSFNQMALKAVFTGVALNRILGLAGRRTPDLARMAEDYASERRAAGRGLPADLGFLTGEGRATP